MLGCVVFLSVVGVFLMYLLFVVFFIFGSDFLGFMCIMGLIGPLVGVGLGACAFFSLFRWGFFFPRGTPYVFFF